MPLLGSGDQRPEAATEGPRRRPQEHRADLGELGGSEETGTAFLTVRGRERTPVALSMEDPLSSIQPSSFHDGCSGWSGASCISLRPCPTAARAQSRASSSWSTGRRKEIGDLMSGAVTR